MTPRAAAHIERIRRSLTTAAPNPTTRRSPPPNITPRSYARTPLPGRRDATYDAVGTRLWPRPWVMPLIPVVPSPTAAVLRMRGGQTIKVDYHLPGIPRGGPPGPVARYVGHCATYTTEPS